MSFVVKALTPLGIAFEKEVSEAYFPSIQGPIGIFTDYAPGMISLQPAGIIRLLENKQVVYYAVFGGVVKIENNVLTILTDDIEDGFTIDMARAIASRDRANDRLEKKDPETDILRAKASLLRALTRIETKNLSLGKKV